MKKPLIIITIVVLFFVISCTNTNENSNPKEKVVFEEKIDEMPISLDSVCITEGSEHYEKLLAILKESDLSFDHIVSMYKDHITDTITKFKSKNIIILDLAGDYGLELQVKGLKRMDKISYSNIKADNIELFKYYRTNYVIKDDEIKE
jgi:hypothetical protein